MDLLNFEKENIIYNESKKYSVLEYTDTHGFTPEILKDKKNVVSVYQTSSIQDKREVVFEYICKVQGLYYIYLTLSNVMSEEDNYKMRIYYDYNDRQQINLLLTSLKK
jgi:hypothetical protein